MAKHDNIDKSGLVMFSDMTPERHKELSAKGGRNSGITKRKAKSMREAARVILEANLTDDEKRAAIEALGLEPDQQSAILLAAAEKAKHGDIEAARFIRDTSGQSPAQQVQLGGIDGQPIEMIDLTGLSNDELRALLQKHSDPETGAAE